MIIINLIYSTYKELKIAGFNMAYCHAYYFLAYRIFPGIFMIPWHTQRFPAYQETILYHNMAQHWMMLLEV